MPAAFRDHFPPGGSPAIQEPGPAAEDDRLHFCRTVPAQRGGHFSLADRAGHVDRGGCFHSFTDPRPGAFHPAEPQMVQHCAERRVYSGGACFPVGDPERGGRPGDVRGRGAAARRTQEPDPYHVGNFRAAAAGPAAGDRAADLCR